MTVADKEWTLEQRWADDDAYYAALAGSAPAELALAPPLWQFHLPGKHDQKSHGRAEEPETASAADDLSGLWNLTAAAPRRVPGPSLRELDDAADEMAAVVATQLGRVAGFAARNLGGVTIAASGLWNFQTGAGPGTPRQAAVSADDLGMIRDAWIVVTDDVLGPKIAADYLAGAKGQHGRLAAALPAGARGLPGMVNTQQAALQYAAQAANRWKDVGDELWAAARTALLEGMAKGESVDKLARRVRDATGVSMGRAMTIARTESMAARSAGSYEEMLASGVVVSKTWQATGDLRTRPTHVVADGQTVPMADKFTVGGWPADRPHDLLLPPEESTNCRCTLVYGLDTDVATGESTLAEATRARQAELERVRPLADGTANVDELIPRADAVALRRHIESLARHHTISREDRDDWLAAVDAGDLRRLRRLVNRVADDADLLPIGQAGQRTVFDPAVHTVLGGAPPEAGVLVEVVRRGYRLTRDGESILLFKAIVEVLGTAASGGLWAFHLGGKHDQHTHGRGAGGVRKELADAKSLDGVNLAAQREATRITGRTGDDAVQFTFTDSGPEVAKQHAEGVLRSLEEFPDAPLRSVNDFDPDAPGPMYYGHMASAIAFTSMGHTRGSINFNARYAGDPDRYRSSMAHSARVGHLADPTPFGVATHEFGHILTLRPGATGPPRVPAKKIATEAAGGHGVRAHVRKHLSDYATTTSHELNAEAFSDHMAHGDKASPLTKLLLEEIRKLHPKRK